MVKDLSFRRVKITIQMLISGKVNRRVHLKNAVRLNARHVVLRHKRHALIHLRMLLRRLLGIAHGTRSIVTK